MISTTQGSCVTFSSRHMPWSKSLKLKQCLTKHHRVGRTDWHYLLKLGTLSVGPSYIFGAKIEPFRISAFKGSSHNYHKGSRPSGLKVPNAYVRLEESGEAKSEPPEAQNVPLSYASEANNDLANDNLPTSTAIHKLFKKWLTLLLTQPSSEEVKEVLGESTQGALPETLDGTQVKERGEVLKVAWTHFLALDETIKIPLLVFIPFYLAVNVRYGAKVSKELTPLWVVGPLVVALYVVIIRKLWSFYAFSFKQTVKVIKNFPSCCILAYSYVFGVKIKEDIQSLILQPILSIKDIDYKEQSRRKLKELEEWIVEKYLDSVESIWPYYCRTIRFLKRANLI
ncbi:uncharacterized protein LOC129307677 isoform X2 [Prosopis cineraria]|uniref:uncharacterized protein LOC129307677 isoform X2 n=1 Tax=Prosopis cineraria TaxID=364024 RepID=UPI00241060B9|nr:uncharacterized protein LOC129307677 isoform X2 [Prosopis cineraria]